MPETKNLTFATGLTVYRVNGCCEVAFNPTDAAFAEKLYRTFETLEQKQKDYDAQTAGQPGGAVFDLMRERDREMRELVDGVFGVPVCTPLFGDMNVWASADGLPVWANLLLTIMDELDDSIKREQQAQNPRVQKYLNKYKR